MANQKIIDGLKEIKKSILLGAGGGVTDTLWMSSKQSTSGETMVEFIDGMLVDLGEKYEQLEDETSEILEPDHNFEALLGK